MIGIHVLIEIKL